MAEKVKRLTPKQELFCQLYSSDKEFFGNGVESYAEAFDIDISLPGQYNVAKVGAYRLLTTPYVLERINKLLELGPLNDTSVDKQLGFVIAQNADLGSKVAAIREYNKLKKRINDKLPGADKDNPVYIVSMTKDDADDD